MSHVPQGYRYSREFLELCLAEWLSKAAPEDARLVLRKFRTRSGAPATEALKRTAAQLRHEGAAGFERLRAEQEAAYNARTAQPPAEAA